MNKTINTLEENEVSKEIGFFIKNSKLYNLQALKAIEFPFAILIRNAKGKAYTKDEAKSLICRFYKSKGFSFPKEKLALQIKDGSPKLYNLGNGVAIPVHKDIDVSLLLQSLIVFAKNENKKLKIDICKDSVFQNGRNIVLQFKGLAPLTTENALEIFSDYGTAAKANETEDGWTVVYKDVIWQMILQSYIHSPGKYGRWFQLSPGSSIKARFTSSTRCSICNIHSHHKDNCNEKIVEMKLKYDLSRVKTDSNTPQKPPESSKSDPTVKKKQSKVNSTSTKEVTPTSIDNSIQEMQDKPCKSQENISQPELPSTSPNSNRTHSKEDQGTLTRKNKRTDVQKHTESPVSTTNKSPPYTAKWLNRLAKSAPKNKPGKQPTNSSTKRNKHILKEQLLQKSK